ncbi:MAG: hypothetical protein AAF989_08320, partial [Planctomycetota bacterium]
MNNSNRPRDVCEGSFLPGNQSFAITAGENNANANKDASAATPIITPTTQTNKHDGANDIILVENVSPNDNPRDKSQMENSKEDDDNPNFVYKEEDDEDFSSIANISDAPQYKNQSYHDLKRKVDAPKAISTHFPADTRFGGSMEEDWERHKEEYETIALYYQLCSKDLAFYLRLTLKDQALAVYKTEYPK